MPPAQPSRSRRVVHGLVCAVALVWPAAAHGQDARVTDRDGLPFRTPGVAPNEPVHRLAALTTNRDTIRRTIVFAELGDRIGFWLRRDPTGDFELAAGLHAGAASRFDLAGPSQDFIEIRYRVGMLLRARISSVAIRAELFHVSSHLGDEFMASTGAEPISTSREGIEVLLQTSPLPGLWIYGGPGLLIGSSRGRDKRSVRAGVDWESAADGLRAYASGDVFAWSEVDWGAGWAFEGGVAAGDGFRFGLLAGFGQTRAEQFLGDRETVVGVSFSFIR